MVISFDNHLILNAQKVLGFGKGFLLPCSFFFSSVGNGVVVLSPFKNTRGPAESALVLLAKGWKVLILDREPREGGVSQSGQNVTPLLQQQTLPSQRNYKASKSF